MKYLINSYDVDKDVAVVTMNYKFKTVAQPALTIRAHNVPVNDKEMMDTWALGVVAAKKYELRRAEVVKAIAPALVTEQTVTEPAE